MSGFLNGSHILPLQSLYSFTLDILIAGQVLCQVTVFCLLLWAGWLKMSSFQIFICYPTVLFPLLDQGRMPNSFPFCDRRTWSYGSYQKRCSLACNYLLPSTSVLFSWVALAESCESGYAHSIEHCLAVWVWDGGAEWHWVDGGCIHVEPLLPITLRLTWHKQLA